MYVLIAWFFMPTASWEKPVLIAALVLVAVVVLVIVSLYWYRHVHRKRLRERQRVNEETGTWLQESSPRGRGQRVKESKEDKVNLEYSQLKYVGSFKDSAEETEVMVWIKDNNYYSKDFKENYVALIEDWLYLYINIFIALGSSCKLYASEPYRCGAGWISGGAGGLHCLMGNFTLSFASHSGPPLCL